MVDPLKMTVSGTF